MLQLVLPKNGLAISLGTVLFTRPRLPKCSKTKTKTDSVIFEEEED